MQFLKKTLSNGIFLFRFMLILKTLLIGLEGTKTSVVACEPYVSGTEIISQV